MKNLFCQGLLLGFLLCFIQPLHAQATSDYTHLDPEGIIPYKLLDEAVNYYDKNLAKIRNTRYMGVIDFSQHNSKERFYIIDMESGTVETYLAAHGRGSDPSHTGYAKKFSNINNSYMTSLGFYLTAETYNGGKGYSLRLDGLSTTNSNARSRLIVIHGADYVAPGNLIGRSEGCPALEMRYHQAVINQLKGGALLYAGLSR